ncbi:hypothetical protein BCR35DRAFT_355509 [Leucosporidium creatinivorum]|uniref:ABM domain-containing protein n=1 Tax=Leucosporidium creatinivorum TaxID=106004 RepID=A0A1Y2DE69_9BASI|nr:hypothetical protein BCR35DRAFT_355509 [Leucosporidium creatinivorum]
MVLTFIVSLELKSADKASEVAEKLVAFAEAYRKDEGTLDWIVSQDTKNPTRFALVERYATKAAIKTHTSNPNYPKFGAYFKELLASPPKITMYEELPKGGSKL